jgi:hypothetical protein
LGVRVVRVVRRLGIVRGLGVVRVIRRLGGKG